MKITLGHFQFIQKFAEIAQVKVHLWYQQLVMSKTKGQTFRYRFRNETKTFWYRSRICLVENRLFRFGPKSALLDQIEMISFDGADSGTNSDVLVSFLLNDGTFVERLLNVCPLLFLHYYQQRLQQICLLCQLHRWQTFYRYQCHWWQICPLCQRPVANNGTNIRLLTP